MSYTEDQADVLIQYNVIITIIMEHLKLMIKVA